MRRLLEQWERLTLEAKHLETVGDTVLARVVQHGKGWVSGIEVEDDVVVVANVAYMRGRYGIEVQARSAWLITMRDHKVASFTLYQTKQEALEAAGLSE